MPTSPAARSGASKLARQLLQQQMNARIAAVTALDAAATTRDTAAANVTNATERGAALVRDAQQRAAALLADAETGKDDAATAYAETYQRTLDTGWSPNDLAQMGLAAPPRTRRTPRRTSDEQPTGTPAAEAPAPGEHPATVIAPVPAQALRSES